MKCMSILISLICFCSGISQGGITSIVGDIDNFHAGDAVDTPYRSALLLSCPTGSWATEFKDTDVAMENWGLGYTHSFVLPAGAVIESATLTVGVYSWDSRINTAGLMLDVNVDPALILTHLNSTTTRWNGPTWQFSDTPGYVQPLPNTTTEFVIDLSQVPMHDGWNNHWMSPTATSRNLLSELYDGEFNVWGSPDTGIDYSILTIQFSNDDVSVVPAPGALLLAGMGAGFVGLFRRKTL